MTRPEDIPADVWDRAVEVTIGTMAFGSPRLTEGFARAILAERERSEREVLARIRDRLVEKRGDPRAYGQGFYDPLGPQIAALDVLLRG